MVYYTHTRNTSLKRSINSKAQIPVHIITSPVLHYPIAFLLQGSAQRLPDVIKESFHWSVISTSALTDDGRSGTLLWNRWKVSEVLHRPGVQVHWRVEKRVWKGDIESQTCENATRPNSWITRCILSFCSQLGCNFIELIELFALNQDEGRPFSLS